MEKKKFIKVVGSLQWDRNNVSRSFNLRTEEVEAQRENEKALWEIPRARGGSEIVTDSVINKAKMDRLSPIDIMYDREVYCEGFAEPGKENLLKEIILNELESYCYKLIGKATMVINEVNRNKNK